MDVPDIGISRLLLVGTGSVSAADLPFWVNWLRYAYPRMQIQVVVTRSAERFVTRTSLATRSRREVLLDEWPEESGLRARHVELAEWAEVMVVYPATFHFIARLAQGFADSPGLLAAQCTTAPVGIAPALPPGGLDSPAFRMHREALESRPNVVIVPPVPGISVTTGRRDSWAPAPLHELLGRVERLRRGSAAAPESPAGRHVPEGEER
ncbi:flavoprotein [Streptomyces sioyaensis]|uniref:flavoprotein n=1 Tax=Streptomyces sioyaensis TaxID=67364 RepID=UPI0037B35C00